MNRRASWGHGLVWRECCRVFCLVPLAESTQTTGIFSNALTEARRRRLVLLAPHERVGLRNEPLSQRMYRRLIGHLSARLASDPKAANENSQQILDGWVGYLKANLYLLIFSLTRRLLPSVPPRSVGRFAATHEKDRSAVTQEKDPASCFIFAGGPRCRTRRHFDRTLPGSTVNFLQITELFYLTSFVSASCALFSATAYLQPVWNQSLPHSFYRHGGCTPFRSSAIPTCAAPSGGCLPEKLRDRSSPADHGFSLLP